MATRRYSIARGKSEKDITVAAGGATATASMEFTYDRAVGLTKADILAGLDKIRNLIKSEKSLPLS